MVKVNPTTLIQRDRRCMWHSPARQTQTKLSSHPQSQPWHGNLHLSPLQRSPAPVTQKRSDVSSPNITTNYMSYLAVFHLFCEVDRNYCDYYVIIIRSYLWLLLSLTCDRRTDIWIFNYFIICVVQPPFSAPLRKSDIGSQRADECWCERQPKAEVVDDFETAGFWV